jgi:hypothetical protein
MGKGSSNDKDFFFAFLRLGVKHLFSDSVSHDSSEKFKYLWLIFGLPSLGLQLSANSSRQRIIEKL